MNSRLKRLLGTMVSEDNSPLYEEGTELLKKLIEKISNKYKLGIVYCVAQQGHDHHNVAIVNTSANMMAEFISTLITNAKVSGHAIKLIPDEVLKKAFSKRYSKFDRLFWMCAGGTAFAVIFNILIEVKKYLISGAF